MEEENYFKIEGVMSKGYGIMPKMVALDEKLSIESKAIYAFLTSFSGVGQGVYPSVETILHYLKISKNRYYKYRDELIKYGYISIQPRRKGQRVISNLYVLNISLRPHFEDTQNEDTQFEDTQNEDTNNNNNNNNNNNSNKSNLKKKKPSDFDTLITEYTTNEELRTNIYEFIKMRKGIKAAITTLGLKKMLNQLDKLATNDSVKIKILDKSIMNSWKGIYELKGESYGGAKQNTGSSEKKFNVKIPEWNPSYTGSTGDEPI